MQEVVSQQEFDAALALLGGGHPDAEQYQRLTTLVLDHPKAHALAVLDPFSDEYRLAVLDFYATLRSRAGDEAYVAERDEASESGGTIPANLWTGLVPWSFQNPALAAEFLLAWGRILQLLDVVPQQSVLEYGPGSGQILLMLARMGVRTHGVDIDQTALDSIRAQADALGLPVALERAAFGGGFGDERFDAILFFEAFHHALDFPALLERLRGRLKPGGRLVLCGEPIVDAPIPGIPFPWGPRLDALSVHCMRRWGWMELGFTQPFLTEMARRSGWQVSHHPSPDCGRACAFVLTPAEPDDLPPVGPYAAQADASAGPVSYSASLESVTALADQRGRELEALRGSTSWRVTGPLRALGRLRQRLTRRDLSDGTATSGHGPATASVP